MRRDDPRAAAAGFARRVRLAIGDWRIESSRRDRRTRHRERARGRTRVGGGETRGGPSSGVDDELAGS